MPGCTRRLGSRHRWMFHRHPVRHCGVRRSSCEARHPIDDESHSGILRGSQAEVSGVGVGEVRCAQEVEKKARRAISDREYGQEPPLQGTAVLERVQQAGQGEQNQGVIEAEIVARPVRECHGERKRGEAPGMIVHREASQARYRPPGRDCEREYIRVARERNAPRTEEDGGREDAADYAACRGEAVPDSKKLQNAALPELLWVVEEQVYQVPADHACEDRPDSEIPYRPFPQSATAGPPKEQRRREPDACRCENAEGLDRDRPDLQRWDEKIRDQTTTRTPGVRREAATTMTFTFILRLLGLRRDSVLSPHCTPHS